MCKDIRPGIGPPTDGTEQAAFAAPVWPRELHDALLTTAPPSGPPARPNTPPVLAELHGPTEVSPSGRTATLAAALAANDRFYIAARAEGRIEFVERLVAALLRAGERPLVLTATADTANRLAERWREHGAVRALAPGESASDLPAAIADHASAAVGVGRVDEQRARLAESVRDAAARVEASQRVAGVWDRLRAVRCVCAAHGRPSNPDRARTESELKSLREELESLTPLVAAKQAGNVFSRSFWKATFHGELVRRAEDLERRIQQVEEELSATDDTPLPVPCPAGDPQEFDRLCGELRTAGLVPPDAPTVEAIAAAQQAADGDRQEAEARLSYASKTLADLESDPAALAVQHLNRAPIVVGTMAAVTDLAIERGTFDRRILEGAESVTETEWEAATSTTERTIVLGDFTGDGPAATRWRREHRPQWLREDGRLVVRLAPDAEAVRTEPLADRPDIELQFGHAGDAYVLAAVRFPAETTVADAKAFLAAHLDEVLLVPFGPARWSADELAVAWPTLESDDAVWIEVGAGVCERVVSVDGLPATAAVRFDSARWSREAAEAWVETNSRAARARRTAVLAD